MCDYLCFDDMLHWNRSMQYFFGIGSQTRPLHLLLLCVQPLDSLQKIKPVMGVFVLSQGEWAFLLAATHAEGRAHPFRWWKPDSITPLTKCIFDDINLVWTSGKEAWWQTVGHNFWGTVLCVCVALTQSWNCPVFFYVWLEMGVTVH